MRRQALATALGISSLAAPAAAEAERPNARLADAAPRRAGPPPETFLFPVVGGARFIDDWGDPRPQGRHEGNDLMAPRGTPVIAVADGVVRLHSSPRAGHMLYLRARGWEYVYIHLNDDRTAGNDNRGGPGTAFAAGLRTGTRVRAGQVLGYLGNSGDANWTAPHLHFEAHAAGRGPVNPYARLRTAPIVYVADAVARPVVETTIAARAPGTTQLTLVGRLASALSDSRGARVAVRVRSVRAEGGRRIPARRLVVLRVGPELHAACAALRRGALVRVVTAAARPTLAHRTLAWGAWTAEAVTPVAP